MASLDELRNRLSVLSSPIRIQVHTRDLKHADLVATRELFDALQISDTRGIVQYEVVDGPGLAVTLHAGHTTHPITFLGTPSGYELEGLVLAVESAAGCDQHLEYLEQSLKDVIAQITEPLHSDLFVSPTCAPCARMVHLAITLAHYNKYLRFRIIQADQFPELGQQNKVSSTPTLIVPSLPPIVGNVPPAHVVFHLWQGAMHWP